MTPYSRIVTAAITLVTAALQLGVTSVVSAQINNDNWCANSQFDNLDATASYSVPGFTYPGDNNASSISINSTWTFSTGAVNFPNDYRNPVQRIWVDTSPVVQIDSDSLPYQGCVLFLLSLTNKVAPEGSQDKNGDCKSVLGEECVNSILKNVTAIAQSIPARTEEDFRRFNQSDSLNYSFEYGQCRGYFVGAAFPDVCGPADDLYIGVGEFGMESRQTNFKIVNLIFNFLSIRGLYRRPSSHFHQRDPRDKKLPWRASLLSERGKRYRGSLSIDRAPTL